MYVLARSGPSSRSGAARRAFTKILFHVNEPKGTNTYLGRIQEGYSKNEYGESYTHPQSFMHANEIIKFLKIRCFESVRTCNMCMSSLLKLNFVLVFQNLFYRHDSMWVDYSMT